MTQGVSHFNKTTSAAYGFFEDDVQAIYTTKCTCCVTPAVVNYIQAVTVAGTKK